MNTRRLIVGISGSSGAILGIRLLQALQNSEIETHLVVSPSARLTIEQETSYHLDDVLALATVHYNPRDIGATIASGSFQTIGMVIIPCSIKSLSAVANSYSEDLLSRAADVTLKEGRPLLLVVRETPLHPGHIRLLDLAAKAGAILFPPVPAFYARPHSLDEVVDNLVGRVLQRMGIENDLYAHWQGVGAMPSQDPLPADDSPAGDEAWSQPALTLATTGADGEPHAAAVYFAPDASRENLYFFSASSSQHSQDLETNPRAAAAIHPPVADWRQINGLQLRGTAVPVAAGDEWELGWQIYQAKFPFIRDLKTIVEQNILYTFRPTWFRRIDNRRGFGFKEEWTNHE